MGKRFVPEGESRTGSRSGSRDLEQIAASSVVSDRKNTRRATGTGKLSRPPPPSKEVVEWVLHKTRDSGKKFRFILDRRLILGTMSPVPRVRCSREPHCPHA